MKGAMCCGHPTTIHPQSVAIRWWLTAQGMTGSNNSVGREERSQGSSVGVITDPGANIWAFTPLMGYLLPGRCLKINLPELP